MYTETGSEFKTRGELIDGYIMYKSEFLSDTEKFLIWYVIPFAAKKMFRIWFRINVSRAEIMEAADCAINYYLMNNNVFQNYIAPKNLDKNTLRESRAKTDWVRIMLNTGFVEENISNPRFLHFTHQYYQEYFAARHIINLIESAKTVYDPLSGGLPANVAESGLFDQWYGGFGCAESDEVYKFIGEICGEGEWTILDSLLEMSRDFNGYFTAENVIRTMKISRNDKIYNLDFSKLKLPFFMCSDADFIDCDFRGCIVPFWRSLDNISFKNCDFSGAVFLLEEGKKLLADLGAEI